MMTRQMFKERPCQTSSHYVNDSTRWFGVVRFEANSKPKICFGMPESSGIRLTSFSTFNSNKVLVELQLPELPLWMAQ